MEQLANHRISRIRLRICTVLPQKCSTPIHMVDKLDQPFIKTYRKLPDWFCGGASPYLQRQHSSPKANACVFVRR